MQAGLGSIGEKFPDKGLALMVKEEKKSKKDNEKGQRETERRKK
jgi:hypothetical protein